MKVYRGVIWNMPPPSIAVPISPNARPAAMDSPRGVTVKRYVFPGAALNDATERPGDCQLVTTMVTGPGFTEPL